MVLVNFSVFLLVVFVVFVGASASDSPSSFPFLSWIFILPYYSSCCLSFGGVTSLLVLVLLLFLLLFTFLHLCVLLLITYVILICFFLSFLLLCLYLVWLILLLWLLSLFLLFLILCFFFSPGPPCTLEKEDNGNDKYFILFAFGGALRKCPLTKPLIVLFFGGFSSSSEHVFVGCSWNRFWGRRALFVASYLLFLGALV